MAKKFIKQVSGKPGSGEATIVFSNNTVSHDLTCGQFFMKMDDEGKSLADARAYAKVGPMIAPTANWVEINRVLEGFR